MILLLAKWKLNFSRRAAIFAELSLYLKYSLCPESHHPNQFHVRQFAKLNKIFQIILEVLKTNAFFLGDDSWMFFRKTPCVTKQLKFHTNLFIHSPSSRESFSCFKRSSFFLAMSSICNALIEGVSWFSWLKKSYNWSRQHLIWKKGSNGEISMLARKSKLRLDQEKGKTWKNLKPFSLKRCHRKCYDNFNYTWITNL